MYLIMHFNKYNALPKINKFSIAKKLKSPEWTFNGWHGKNINKILLSINARKCKKYIVKNLNDRFQCKCTKQCETRLSSVKKYHNFSGKT